jgi:hypothetical protein
MIKVEHVVTPSSDQWKAIIRGMRNPMNSWDRSDSEYGRYQWYQWDRDYFNLGDDDLTLMEKLASAGTDHRKYLRMITVYMDITAPLYWWKEYDTYKVGTVANSCSTMHKIHSKEFTLDDFSVERVVDEKLVKRTIDSTIDTLNYLRERYLETDEKEYWESMIQMLPSSYNQMRTVFMNYEVMRKMYHARKNHKLKEWRDFCKRIEELPYSDLIMR